MKRYKYHRYNVIYIMIKKVMVSIDENVLKEFDEHIGIAKRSTAITHLMKRELENGGGLIV